MEVVEILNEAGYKPAEGRDAVLNMIKSASNGGTKPLCSGYGVFPNGIKCKGCEDCKYLIII